MGGLKPHVVFALAFVVSFIVMMALTEIAKHFNS